MGTEILKYMIAQQCAPVLAGIKPSNLLIIESGNQNMLRHVLGGTHIRNVLLYTSETKDYWLLFEEKELEKQIRQNTNRQYLEQFGYEVDVLQSVLELLKERFTRYKKKEIEFPHEMGVLFGYPLKDVLGFVENDGRNYKMSGYWKVYDDTEYAGRIFYLYKQVKKIVLEMCGQGACISEICSIFRMQEMSA